MYRTYVRYTAAMDELREEDVERLRRSLAMLPAGSPSWMTREQVMDILEQLHRLLKEQAGGLGDAGDGRP